MLNVLVCNMSNDRFFDKTKNEWADRSKFKKVAGKYDLVKMDYNVSDMKCFSSNCNNKKISLNTIYNKR